MMSFSMELLEIIETYWNVNFHSALFYGLPEAEIIETYWNVNLDMYRNLSMFQSK